MLTFPALYLALLGLVALERLAELLLSRRNARRAFARGGVEVGRRQYRVMVVFHTLFLVACAAEPAIWPDARPGPVAATALALALLAQALRYWAIGTLGERWNVRVIVLPGAAPVVGGPYAWVRHPNYVAVAIEIACLPLAYAGAAAWPLALALSVGNAFLLRARIRLEERALGDRYASAFAATPRFFPGGAA